MQFLIGQVRGVGLLRCCRNTIQRYAISVKCELPVEGFVLWCDHCSDAMTWMSGAWEHRYSRLLDSSRDAARHVRADEITDGRFSTEMEKFK